MSRPATQAAMTERDDDIEFDFFGDEGSTQETAVRERAPQRGPRGPVRPPAGITPLLRLVGLIAFAILVVVLLVFWIDSCRGADKQDTYADYMTDVRELARDSQAVGRRFNRLVTTAGVRPRALQTQLNGLAQQQQQIVVAAQGIDPPGRLRTQHRAVEDSLQFRVSGLRGLADAFRRTARSTDADAAASLLSTQAQRLVTSDVVWDDLFRDPARQELRRQGIGGVRVPDSNFLASSELASATALRPIWQRIRGASTGGTPTGLHGTGIASLTALPAETELSQDTETTVTASTDLAFEATIEGTGDSQEVQIPVTLTIQKSPEPIVRRATIPIINPQEQETVVFRNLGQPPFGERTTIKLDVEPVRGETNTSNNTAEYPVIFSLEP